MSILSLAIPSGTGFQLGPSLKSYISLTTSPLSSTITGKPVREIKVAKTSGITELPVSIAIPHKRSQEESKTPKSMRSTLPSPMFSPRSAASSRTFLFPHKSPSSQLLPQKLINPLNETSPRKDISELLKHSLKLQKIQEKAIKKQKETELRSKFEKKLQMKVFDRVIREENLSKFKQKFWVVRPKWGVDDKKVISDTKTLRELEKVKRNKYYTKNSKSVEAQVIFIQKKKIHKKKKRKLERKLAAIEENLSEQDLYKRIVDLGARVSNLKTITTEIATERESGVRIIAKVLRKLLLFYFQKFHKNSLKIRTPSSGSHSFEEEDIEVQNIMRKIDPPDESDSEKSKLNKSYERLLASQMKIKVKQQKQLSELRSKDMMEMIKLADVLGGNSDMKENFQKMIERRYSKLEHLFEENIENIKLALGVGNITETDLLEAVTSGLDHKEESKELEEQKYEGEEFVLPSLRNTISEFSSSFLMQLKEVPASVPNMTFEDPPVEEKDYIDSPSELSIYSRDTLSEVGDVLIVFPKANKPFSQLSQQEEPSQPLISDSIANNSNFPQENSEENALFGLVQDIKTGQEDLIDNNSHDTLDLKEDNIRPNAVGAIYIVEDSFSSNGSLEPPEYSTIVASPPVESEHNIVPEASIKELKQDSTEHSKGKIGRIIIEKIPPFQSPFTNSIETSVEMDGIELLINRVIFTLELQLFGNIMETVFNDQPFWENLPKKSGIAIRKPVHDFEHHVQTDQIAVLSVVKRLQVMKSEEEVLERVARLYSPMVMLSRIQENFEDIDDDMQIFEHEILEYTEKSAISSSVSISSYNNPYTLTHNKLIVDVLNEALLKSAKTKLALPWKIQDQLNVLTYDSLMKGAVQKILRWCDLEAGKIPCIDMINSYGELDEDKLQNIRQEKLGQFLITDVAEGDKSWIDCDFEESQVAIDVSEWILSSLYREIIVVIS